jgi:nucleoside-diphosphate-sugar epimerase
MQTRRESVCKKIPCHKQKVIVSGATGFVGRHLIKELVEKGYEVFALVRDLEKASSIPDINNAKILHFDITNPNKKISLPIDAIFIHCAWENVKDTLSSKHIEEHFINNYLTIKNIIEYGIKKILITGSCHEYGLQYGPLKPSSPTLPNTPYAIAKDTLHKSLRALQAKKNFDLLWVRLFYMYGEGQDEKSIVSLFDRALANGDTVFNMSNGEQLFDYLPVEIVAKKIIKLLNHKDGTFNVCSGTPISLRRLLENRAKAANKKIKLNLGFYEYRKQEALAIWGDESFEIQANDIANKNERER